MQALEESLKNSVESGNIELPILPAVSAEVLALTRSEEADAAQLARLIQNDQSLTGHVMRLANSAAFVSSGQMQTLQQAITRLGMRQIGQMALTVSIGQSVFKADASTEQLVEYLWKHSLATAVWAREIARISRSNTEVAFLCGLLHQIGKPVAINTVVKLLDDENESLKAHRELLYIIEKYNKVIGVNLAKRWAFPDVVVEVINHVDEHFAAPNAGREILVINAAKLLAARLLEGKDAEELVQTMRDSETFQELNFYDEDFQDLVAKTDSVNSLLESLKV